HAAPPPPQSHALPLHDALPIWRRRPPRRQRGARRLRRGALLMARNNDRDRGTRRGVKDTRPTRGKKKVCIFCKDHIEWVDYKDRSEEHTSELQSQSNLVCRLLL